MSEVVKIQGFTPLPHQRAVIDILKEHPKGATIVIKSSRQKGKTLLLNQLLLQNAININGTNSVLIEPTNRGCKRVLKEIIAMLKGIPIVEGYNLTDQEITFINGSTLSFISAESEDALRGISLKANSLLTIDEAAFIKDYVFGIVMPFANVHNNTKIIVSTPKFKSGQYYKYYDKAKKGDKNFYLIDFNNYDTSKLITEEQLEEAKSTMPYNIFLNEYMGEFLAEQGNVFGSFGHCISDKFDTNNKEFYMGIDWSQNVGKDNTAISIFNSKREQVKLVYFNDRTVTQTINTIVKLIKEYKPKKVTCESNSMGKTNYDLLKETLQNQGIKTSNIRLFNTNNTSKRKIIEDLIVLIEKGDVQFLDDVEMKLELTAYEMETTKSGTGVTYNARGGCHDDCVMSSAICLDSLKTGNYTIL